MFAGEETLVFPVEAGRAQEALAIEIGADAGLDAGDMVHQDESPAILGRLRLEQRRDVAAVRERADECVTGGSAILKTQRRGREAKSASASAALANSWTGAIFSPCRRAGRRRRRGRSRAGRQTRFRR